mmetsp:Transcript_20381/g.69078  ORF Transcript_20381/g.69078 Transcript_20381/m.69078 type:complete len:216 (-) Transcript_20381:141-788(-)
MAPRTRSASSSEKGWCASPAARALISRWTSTRAQSSRRDVYSFFSGSILSSATASGHAAGVSTNIKTLSTGVNAAAMRSRCGPVKMADGKISPTKSTTITETMAAAHLGTSSSRKRGSPSLEMEFKSRSVHKTWWCGVRSTKGRSLAAQRFSAGVPVRSLTRRSKASSETMPSVNPAASEAPRTQPQVRSRATRPGPLRTDSVISSSVGAVPCPA